MFTGKESRLIRALDRELGRLGAGVLVTWNGARFDLPYLHDRARLLNIPIGLELVADGRFHSDRDPLPGHDGGYTAVWHRHSHLDVYQVYRADVGASLGLPCGLKPLARMVGLSPVDVDRANIHELTDTELERYVASDAMLTRELALRRWPTARLHIDGRLQNQSIT